MRTIFQIILLVALSFNCRAQIVPILRNVFTTNTFDTGIVGGAIPYFDFPSGKFVATGLVYTNGFLFEPTLGFFSIFHTNTTGDVMLVLQEGGIAGPSIQGYSDKLVVANTNLTLDAVGPFSIRLRVDGSNVLEAVAGNISLSGKTNLVADNGSALTYNGIPIGGGLAGTVLNSVASAGLLAVDGSKTNGISATLAHMTNALGLTGSTTTFLRSDGTQAAPASTTINPTDGYLPFRQSATAFGNSPWYSNFTNRLGFNATNTYLYLNTFDVGIGLNSLSLQTNVQANTAIGVESMKVANGANNSVSIGYRSLFKVTTGGENNSIGLSTLGNLTTGANNTAVGNAALGNSTTSSQNTAFGFQAGRSNTIGQANVFIGYIASPSAVNRTNEIVIGARALGNGSNTATIGDANIVAVYLNGNVTIVGTTNQVTFGATNAPPVSSAAPTKWISVTVTGDAGVYRLPLYE